MMKSTSLRLRPVVFLMSKLESCPVPSMTPASTQVNSVPEGPSVQFVELISNDLLPPLLNETSGSVMPSARSNADPPNTRADNTANLTNFTPFCLPVLFHTCWNKQQVLQL